MGCTRAHFIFFIMCMALALCFQFWSLMASKICTISLAMSGFYVSPLPEILTGAFLRNFLLEPEWQPSIERCRKMGDGPSLGKFSQIWL
jgi:hypothetical protein